MEEAGRKVHLDELGDRLSGLRLRVPAEDERVRRSLERHGQLTALCAFDDGDRLQLVDGFKRVRAAQRLGWQSLRVCVLELGEAEATAAIATLHQQRGLTQLEEGWVARALLREHGLSQGAIARLAGKHKSWVCRRLMLVAALCESVQADVRLGLLSPRAAIAVAALPRGNQEQAARLVVERGMTTRQAESLVRRLVPLDSDQLRSLALARCAEDSTPQDAPRRPARPRSDAELLMSDVATLMRVGVRLEVRLLSSPLAALGPDAVKPTQDALGELGALLGALARAVARAVLFKERSDATLAHA